ncbi:hypothetical protein OHA37_13460 [Streptomyces sp. NBC_00335]|uniref:hypothetical protein n=1 Tax=unclassified Streptomyces TaxID=2593676 RepID=UPI002251903B|nr:MULTISPECIES: hypothetical protein [unclassified Streptomyces]MCX5404887.1 hypothetical protein [Streptomyces sp. NBC_00086]
MITTRSAPRLAAALLAVLTATACSSGGEKAGSDRATQPAGEQSGVPEDGKVEARDATIGLVLPIDAYDVSDDQIVRTGQALNLLNKRCLSRFGLQQKQLPASTVVQGSAHIRRYGTPASLDIAQKYGFHMPQGDPRAFTSDQMVRQPTAVVEVLRGMKEGSGEPLTTYNGMKVPEGGCAKESQRNLANGGEARAGHAETAAAIKARSFETAKKDPRVTAAEKQWAGCMAAKGYSAYKGPFDAIGDPKWSAPKATPDEIETAVASWTCGKESNIVGTWVTVETAYQQTQIAQNTEKLKEEQKTLESEAKRLDDIITAAEAQ